MALLQSILFTRKGSKVADIKMGIIRILCGILRNGHAIHVKHGQNKMKGSKIRLLLWSTLV